MLVYIIRRIMPMVLIMLGASAITFSMMHLVPGDPAEMIAIERYGEDATAETIEQISEPFVLYQDFKKKDAMQKVIEILNPVQILSSSEQVKSYPHELSGGMRQRAMIAMGLACTPSLIIADGPTKGLDVTIQAQIIGLIKELRAKSRTSMLLITHDLGVAAELCDNIVVMYPGDIVEYANIKEFFKNPKHPYTQGFLNSLPSRGLKPMSGMNPSLIDLPEGCKFYSRCLFAMDICRSNRPEIVEIWERYFVRCFLY